MKKSDIEKMILNMVSSSKNRKPVLRLHEELDELIKRYSLILNRDMIEYLQKLVNGEFSVVSSKYIRDEDRKLLSELQIYKLVAIRNIYDIICVAYYKLIKELGHSIVNINTDNYCINVSISIDCISYCVYKFKYDDISPLGNNIPDEYISMNIGTFNLYHSEENINARELKLESTFEEFFRLQGLKNPYTYRNGIGGISSREWEFDRYQKINNLEKEFKRLDRLNISDLKKEEIELTSYAHNIIMENLEVEEDEFKESKNKDIMKKVLVKSMPNLSFKDTIKYI